MKLKKSSFKKRFFLLIPLLLTLFLISLWMFFLTVVSPVDLELNQTQLFVIPKGQAVSVIANRLEEEGLIKNSLAFRFIVKKNGLAQKIQAGSFDLSTSMSSAEIAQKLTQGTYDLWVTIPEGWRREEIADSLAKQELESFSKEEFLQLTQGLEGRLFPDTYLVPRQISAEQLARLLQQTFEKKIIKGLEDDLSRSSYSLNEVLTMASIVERESKGYDQMRKVAGVLWKRIDIGMALQVDASLQYIKGYDSVQDSWWVTPTAEDKKLSSVFNTYKYPGLPPAPIANPGFDAIKATLNSIDTGSLYYLHDRSGDIHFAQTLDGHNENIDRYLRN